MGTTKATIEYIGVQAKVRTNLRGKRIMLHKGVAKDCPVWFANRLKNDPDYNVIITEPKKAKKQIEKIEVTENGN